MINGHICHTDKDGSTALSFIAGENEELHNYLGGQFVSLLQKMYTLNASFVA